MSWNSRLESKEAVSSRCHLADEQKHRKLHWEWKVWLKSYSQEGTAEEIWISIKNTTGKED